MSEAKSPREIAVKLASVWCHLHMPYDGREHEATVLSLVERIEQALLSYSADLQAQLLAMRSRVPLDKGKSAIIDPEDYDRVMSRRWYAQPAKDNWYAHSYRAEGRSQVRLHRFVLDLPDDGTIVDHINRDGLDCRKANLRVCSQSENAQNRRLCRTNTSGFRGVTVHSQTGRWAARIVSQGKSHYLGIYATPLEAALAYDKAATRLFGVHAALNFAPIVGGETP